MRDARRGVKLRYPLAFAYRPAVFPTPAFVHIRTVIGAGRDPLANSLRESAVFLQSWNTKHDG
jgi:hypothetical protein